MMMKAKKFSQKIFFCITFFSLTSCANFHSQPYYFGSISDHFDGERFVTDAQPSGFSQFRRAFLIKDYWGSSMEDGKPVKINEFKEIQKSRIIPVGHATVLIQLPDINILIDPIWSNRAGPISLPVFSVARQNPPAIRFEDLPRIDYVFISSNSYYHMDLPTIEKLRAKFNPKFLTGLGNCYYLTKVKNLDLTCVELDWDQKVNLQNGTDFTFTKTKNWSKRSWFDTNKTLWGGFAITTPMLKIYYSGDTGYSANLFREIYAKFGRFDVAILPIGSYEPKWAMGLSHMNPDEAVKAHVLLNARKSIAVHFRTFQTTTEGYYDAQIALEEAKLTYELGKYDFVAPKFGEVFEF